MITPVYDALGGYIVANSLLLKYIGDVDFNWLKHPDMIESFGGDNCHELAADILMSLVTLAPRRMDGRQLWKTAPDPFKNAALRCTTRLEAEYLDKDTVATLLVLMKDEAKEDPSMFSRLQGIRGANKHPLNAEFLDSLLRPMSISDRDLTWTEWIRKTRPERFNDLLALEGRWKEDCSTRTPSDLLRAKWVMWLLTSTDRELRDVATRALYWFGRGAPEALFEESIKSLDINDPYVFERMLAASYGVSMARHVDINDQVFVTTTLSDFSRKILNSMFVNGAPFYTTHELAREYASRIIEIALLYNQELFSPDEIKKSKPPFLAASQQEWGESCIDGERYHGADSPFRMDFENYSIGRLVSGRRNYDFEHEEYRKIKAKILWRVEQLGWSNELFKNIDRLISNERHWPRTGSDAKKTDRYGKKYSWISYFEISGLLRDQGKLENWRERSSSVDIDPSFPERVAKSRLIQADFLGDPQMEMKEWIANGPLPNVGPYLRLAEAHTEEGPWIALDGYVTQQDERRGRRLFCFIQSFLVAKEEVESFLNHLGHQYIGGRWLPEKPSVIYTFAGEIPWCDTFPHNNLSEFAFVTKEEMVKIKRNQKKLYLDDKKLEWTEIDLIRHRLFHDSYGETEEQQNISDEDLERIEVREVPVEVEEVKKEYANFNALIPVCDFGWEGYQTSASDAGHATTLAKKIASDLELIGQPQTFDLFTKNGSKATLNVSDQSGDFNNHQTMFFIKEDLLKIYLKKNDLSLVWAIWGEREYSSDQVEKFFHGPNCHEQTHGTFSFVKRYA
ncbi:MAG: hypothetical protein HZA01_01545 [Nitrospinae bacterium]|nr:hypothetical protein [Nitrospinota bacterium]